jgi:hypothetical protein
VSSAVQAIVDIAGPTDLRVPTAGASSVFAEVGRTGGATASCREADSPQKETPGGAESGGDAELETLLLGGHPRELPARAALASPLYHLESFRRQQLAADAAGDGDGAGGQGEMGHGHGSQDRPAGALQRLPPVLIMHGS